MDGVGGLEGWRWIFILEGILTVIVAVLAFFVISDFPETAKFLTNEERAWVVKKLKYQGSKDSGHLIAESEQFQWKYVRDAFTDWQVYLQSLGIISSIPSIKLLILILEQRCGALLVLFTGMSPFRISKPIPI